MAKAYVRGNVPLSRFGVLVAQLESIVTSANQQPPDALLCFDILSDLLSAIDEESRESILLWQRKCEDALYSLLTLGARRPVRHLASLTMAKIIFKGDTISIYSRVSSLQGFLSDGKRSDPHRVAGVAQCLGELYRLFGRRITSGLPETTNIASKLMKFHEEFVRQEALRMLESALEGSGGIASFVAYNEAFRLIMRFAIVDTSFIVRIAAARCLKAFANIGGPGLGVGELDNSANCCVKALEDPVSSVRDAFSEALGALLALGMNPEAQVQPKAKGHFAPAKKLEGGLQRHLALPFMKANGARSKDTRIGLSLSWVFFLQAIHMKYRHPDSELQIFGCQVIDMLCSDASGDAQALACVLYILRVGVTDQMMEPTQRSFLLLLGKQLQSSNGSPSMKIAALRTLAYTLKTLGEVPLEFKEILDSTLVASLSHSSQLVRIEASLTLRTLAEVDPTCVAGLISYGVTTLTALRENVSFEKGSNLKVELDSFHGQATVLAALMTILAKLPLGYPSRLPTSVLDISKKMLTESSMNPLATSVEKEAGWLLLASLIASMPKEELEEQVFDILSLWASFFSGNPEHELNDAENILSRICVWSAAVDALTAFVKCFVSPNSLNNGILIQPVVVYLSRALSYISFLAPKEDPNIKPSRDIFIIRTLFAYQSLSDPRTYNTDHPQIIQICTTPFRAAPGCEESSCLRLLLDKRDAWLGPWIPGRDWFEDELRAFQGGKDGLLPCVWESEVATFPQPETISKMVLNQMLLCFGVMFASQDNDGMLSLLGTVEQCLKSGKKQSWQSASITNICVGLLAGLKALLALRPQPLGLEILNSAQSIFLGILAEEDICTSQRRAASEGLGILGRLGNDIFTARMIRLLLGDLPLATDLTYAGSIAFALGCIHRSAGGMALSSLVSSTVSSISSLARKSNSGLQIWSLHGLLLTIEAAGLSYVSLVQATLGLAMDILQSEENGWLDLQQGVGRIINAIVAVFGPELAEGSVFFSRCKSVVAEISFRPETATLFESVRFTQQLVLFAPQAVSVHTHVQTLLPTMSSRQPALRHLAISTIRHLIEKDSKAIIDEQVEDDLFHMLDEETDSEIGHLVRTTIMRLLYVSCPSFPSRWISICCKMVLATSTRRDNANNNAEHDPSNSADGDTRFKFGEDDENMVSNSKGPTTQGSMDSVSSVNRSIDKHLRFKTRVFAAECLSHIPTAVGKNPAQFDLALARKLGDTGHESGDWLVLQIQELISLAYQISTMQIENMQPIGVGLLSTILDKFEMIQDPELPGHLLLEQYQAQLVSAVRTSLNLSSGPLLLEAGLQLATKILTSGIISADQASVKYIFSLIFRPLNDFKDLYYPSFAEWVSCKIKIRLLAAHASLKCYTFAFLRRSHTEVPDGYLALIPLFSENSSFMGNYWIRILKDYSYICFHLHLKRNWKPFLEIQSPLHLSKLQSSLEEAWPVILQALALDAVPANSDELLSKRTVENISANPLICGYSMVKLKPEEFEFLWGFALYVVFQEQHFVFGKQVISLSSAISKFSGELPVDETNYLVVKLYEIVLPVFQFLSTDRFFSAGFLTVDVCKELLQVFLYSIGMEDARNSLATSVLLQIVQNCPDIFFENEDFAYLTVELCTSYLLKLFHSSDERLPNKVIGEDLISPLFGIAKMLMVRFETKKQLKSILALLLVGYKCIRRASTESCFSKVDDFMQFAVPLLKKQYDDKSKFGYDFIPYVKTILGACVNVISSFTRDFIEDIHTVQYKTSDSSKFPQMKLAFSLEQSFSLAKLGHAIDHLEEWKDSKTSYFSMYKVCTSCFKDVLSNSNIQVRAVGLQVLKSILQRGVNVENSFLLFFSGELLTDIFYIIHEILKKPLTRESVALAVECLRILVLLQILCKTTESQTDVMKLVLEAIFMVFSASENCGSQEVNDIRNTAIRLVAHLAQIPSKAVQFKNHLLGMPSTHKQYLQDILRVSATQDSNTSQIKPTVPSLAIKLPLQTHENTEKTNTSTDNSHSKNINTSEEQEYAENDECEEQEDADDDWDTFQSFPASTDAVATNLDAENAPKSNIIKTDSSAISDSNIEYYTSHHYPESPNRQNINTECAKSHTEEEEGVFVSNEGEIVSDYVNSDTKEKVCSGSEDEIKLDYIKSEMDDEVVHNEDEIKPDHVKSETDEKEVYEMVHNEDETGSLETSVQIRSPYSEQIKVHFLNSDVAPPEQNSISSQFDTSGNIEHGKEHLDSTSNFQVSPDPSPLHEESSDLN